tara:strand:- start:3 stop:323 length:321 start_codon:yes stop_codon:yes gene_type:complete
MTDKPNLNLLNEMGADIFGSPSAESNFIITHNVIDEEEPRKRTASETAAFPHYFELYDDDKILYARGYSNENKDEDLFEPLDEWGASYGCTGIKYRNLETNKMEWM